MRLFIIDVTLILFMPTAFRARPRLASLACEGRRR
jgi:hypothetical protein